MRKQLLILLTVLLVSGNVFAQKATNIGDSFPDFNLIDHNGKTMNNASLKSKNTLYVFVRGKVSDHWCNICHYQYAELAKYDKENNLRKKLDMEIVFVLPYSKAEVKEWCDIFPKQLDVVYDWKNPKNESELNDGQKSWMNLTRKLFPLDIRYKEGEVPLPFSILVDEEQKLSKELGLYTLLWDNSYVEQNKSTIFGVDKNGIVQFKHFSQNTFDRIKPEYIEKVLTVLLK